jgi:hypothetical protein
MHSKLQRLFAEPPPGSAIARAREYGVDLTQLARNLELSPEQRFAKTERALDMAREIRLMRQQAKP